MELSEETKTARQELIDGGADEEAVDAYISLGIGDDDLSDFEEAYCGKFRDNEDFARDMAENIGAVDSKQNWPLYCIDWEWASRELMMDYSEADGHYFRNL